MNKISRVLIFLFLSCAAFQGAAIAQKDGSVRSYTKARFILDAGINALGGLDAMRKAEDMALTSSGDSYLRNQSVKVDPPYARITTDETLFINLNRQQYIFESQNPRFGNNKTIVSNGQAFFVDPTDRTISTADPATIPTTTFNYIRRLPHLLLTYALEQRAATLRYLGEEIFEGRKHNVVTFASSNGTLVALFFDAQTNLLSKHEQIVEDVVDGDALQETIFPGYRAVGGVKIPTRRIMKRGGEIIEDVKYSDVRLNTRPPDSAFTKPEGLTEAASSGQFPMRETKLADGVYLFESEFNSLVIEFEDHVMVVEPHTSGRGPRATISKVREMFPAKPIRYIVVTHHHFDHAGGSRSYVATGASIVTTPTNRRYFERIAASNFTIMPDAQTTARRTPAFTLVEGGKRVFSDSKQRVEVIDIGPGPHSQEMLIVYLPKEKLVFQGDLLRLNDDGKYETDTVDDIALNFYDAMIRLGLKVERVAAVHGPTTTMDDFRKEVEKKRKAN